MTNTINKPTEEEIQTILRYFDMNDEQLAYDIYLKALVEKHGEKWVENALNTVIALLSVKK